MKRTITLCCGLMMGLTIEAQESIKISAGKYNGYGLAYTLPATEVQIIIEYDEVVAKAGPFSTYAEHYLGVPATIKADASYCEFKQAYIRTRSSVEKGVHYVAQVKNAVPFIYLNNQGIILSINTQPTERPKTKTTVADSTVNETAQPALSVFTEEMLLSGSTVKMAENAAKQLYRIRESRVNLLTGDVDNLPADGASFTK